jgi:hypothetical protein
MKPGLQALQRRQAQGRKTCALNAGLVSRRGASMNNLVLTAALAMFASTSGLSTAARAAEIVPCEDMLKSTKDTLAAATTLAAADKTKVDELITKGTDRCNADDDKRADGFFADAMKLMGK